MLKLAIAIVTLCFLGFAAVVQTPRLEGAWHGTFNPGGTPIEISIIFQRNADKWAGSLALPGGQNIRLNEITLQGNSISFSLDALQVKAGFRGTISADQSEIIGEFLQQSTRFPLKLSPGLAAETSTAEAPINSSELIGMVISSNGPLSARPFVPPVTHPAIGYGTRAVHDPVAQLKEDIDAGKVQLKFEGEHGYLRSLLDALRIPVESQMAVFSRTSLQSAIIGPQNPRVLYFNDTVVVGSVREGFIEVAAQDPELGTSFYTMLQQPADRPLLLKRDGCLSCHLTRNSLDVPGMIVRSVYPAPNGEPINPLGSHLLDHRTPFDERWGGWYVTGATGSMRHLGNGVVSDPTMPESMVSAGTLNLATLKGKFETDVYLSPYSDIVALLVFDHQMHMMNLITRVGWDYRIAASLEADLGKPNAVLESQLRDDVAEFVDYLLFVKEAPLPGKVEGVSGFAEKFAAQGPTDTKGRSLRQFDLERRLMRYPCSYMIYSAAFDGMPDRAKKAIYARMREALKQFAAADRDAILEILHDTKKDF
jgi:hypothetical protein